MSQSSTTGRFTVETVPDVWIMNMVQGRMVFSNPMIGVKNVPYSQVPPGAIIKKNAPPMRFPKRHATLLHPKPGQEQQDSMSTRSSNNMGLEYQYKYNARTLRNKKLANARKPQDEANAFRNTQTKKLQQNLDSIDEEAYARMEGLTRPRGMTNETWERASGMLAQHKNQHARRKAQFAERQAQFVKKGGRNATKTRKRRHSAFRVKNSK